MTQSLAKYHARSPRYILQPQDNTLIRVAGPHQSCWEEDTEIKNISLSGLVFTAAAELCPIVSEIIKIEFEVPGFKRMACYGLVTRLEPYSRMDSSMGQSQLLVAIQFLRLELAHRVALLQGLTQKMKEQQERAAAKEFSNFMTRALEHWPLTFLLFGIIAAWVFLINLSSHNLKN